MGSARVSTIEDLRQEIAYVDNDLRGIAGCIGDLETSYGGKANQTLLEEWRRREVIVKSIRSRLERLKEYHELEELHERSLP